MFSVGAVWVLPFVTNCHTLSTPIREAIPDISNVRTSRQYFVPSFNSAKPEEKNNQLNQQIVQNVSWLLTICQRPDINQEDKVSRRKINGFELIKILKIFDQFGQQKARCRSKQGPYAFRHFFFANWKLHTVTPQESPREKFFKKVIALFLY